MNRKTSVVSMRMPRASGKMPTDPIPPRMVQGGQRMMPSPYGPLPVSTDAERAQGNRDWRAEFLFDLETLDRAPTCGHGPCLAAWVDVGGASVCLEITPAGA